MVANANGDDGTSHMALLALHRTAGTVKGGGERFAPMPTDVALAAVAAAPHDSVTLASRLHVLGALARADFPGYEDHEEHYLSLAESIGRPHGVPADQILTDMKAAAEDPATFAASPTAQALPHETTAFFMQDVCSIHVVDVDGKPATWIFSEFETDTPFDQVAAWVNPVNWPERSPQMFKKMEPVDGPPASIPSPAGVTQWHAIFHEQVQLVDRLDTFLSCDYYESPGSFAGMTYDLDRSQDDQINVDRGFLLAVDLGESRHVKALKIVGFTDRIWNDVAEWVCPFWTDFVRGAVKGGSSSTPGQPPGSDLPQRPDQPTEGGGLDPGAVFQDWAQFMGDAVADYSEMAADWVDAITTGSYGAAEMMRDGARMWSQLARDWARAWARVMETLEELSQAGIDVSSLVPSEAAAPGGDTEAAGQDRALRGRGNIEGTTLPMPGLDPSTGVAWGEFVRIGADGTAVPGDAVIVRISHLGDVPGVHIEMDTSAAPPGLYLSELVAGPKGEFCKPVQLYVSKARFTEGGR